MLQCYAYIKIERIALKIEDNQKILEEIGRQALLKFTQQI